MKNVLVTGLTGQDGAWMVDFLLGLNDTIVVGGVRRISNPNNNNYKHNIGNPRFRVIPLDISDPVSVSGAIETEHPDYVLNFAANSFVGSSWDMPINCFDTNTMSVVYFLDAIKRTDQSCRFYNAGSSEEWGNVDFTPQDETHPLKPRSPYGASKASARHVVKVYRESYGIYAVQGWLFNHESERRGEEFVTRKITKHVAKYHIDKNIPPLALGNLNAERDWSHAEDHVAAVWRMMNQDAFNKNLNRFLKSGSDLKELSKHIKDYVVSSDECHSIREFVELAFKEIGVEGEWVNKTDNPINEKYICLKTGNVLVKVSREFYRPAEIDILRGDSSKIRSELGWYPKNSFEDLVKRMVKNDLTIQCREV